MYGCGYNSSGILKHARLINTYITIARMSDDLYTHTYRYLMPDADNGDPDDDIAEADNANKHDPTHPPSTPTAPAAAGKRP